MKISNSKKELARIISENGGWRDGANFSAIEMHNGDVWFCKEKPEYKVGVGIFSFKDFAGIIEGKFAFPGWHQCILSREEYFHLHPSPDADADGWIEWSGEGIAPVKRGIKVDVRIKNGEEYHDQILDDECWSHSWGDANIVAYRPHDPEQAQPQSPVEMAFDIIQQGVKAEVKPTIEQLAADYRNRKDYADRKQAEADAARADTEAKLAELVAAGNALNLVISVAEEEPELVITDWLDLQVGDVIKCIGCEWDDGFEGNEAVVTGVENRDYKYDHRIRAVIGDESDWGKDFIFIRRP